MDARRNARHEVKRGSAVDRGFDAEWWRNRRIIAKTATRCAECEERLPRDDKDKVIFELDHITARADWLRTHGSYAGVNALSNLRPLCHDCHDAKTRAENSRRPITRRFG